MEGVGESVRIEQCDGGKTKVRGRHKKEVARGRKGGGDTGPCS